MFYLAEIVILALQYSMNRFIRSYIQNTVPGRAFTALWSHRGSFWSRRAVEIHPGAVEAHPGSLEIRPRATEAHPGSLDDHPRDVNHLGAILLP
jgi:hypothetical protein